MTADSIRFLPIEQVRRLMSETSRVPYESVGTAVEPGRDSSPHTKEEGWSLDGVAPLSVTAPIDWQARAEDRAHSYALHSWDFLEPVLAELDSTEDIGLLKYAVDIAIDWLNSFPNPNASSGMAWSDMAVGRRAQRLAFIVDLSARSEAIENSSLLNLFDSVRAHAIAFDSEGMFRSHSSHGLFLSIGQLALGSRLSALPGMDKVDRQGRERLSVMIGTQFTSEGVHREHSPAYHEMVVAALRSLIRVGLYEIQGKPTLADMEEALAWFVRPDGNLVTLGDTPLQPIEFSGDYVSDSLQFVTSKGEVGRPPDASWRSFPESGYVVIRDGWPRPCERFDNWSHLVLNAAFHSSTHKHADDLSFTWYDASQPILIDPGRFDYMDPTEPSSELGSPGFYYSHPARDFVEETRAHNAVEIDDLSYQRRDIAPYGSAVVSAGRVSGVSFAWGQCDNFIPDRASSRIRHRRLLLTRPNEWLLVYDHLTDPSEIAHNYRQWFQFAPDLDVSQTDLGWHARVADRDLWIISLVDAQYSNVARGVVRPRMRGWLALTDQLLGPTSSIYVQQSQVPEVQFATLFTFSPIAPTPVEPDSLDTEVRFGWLDHAEHLIQVEFSEEDGPRLKAQVNFDA